MIARDTILAGGAALAAVGIWWLLPGSAARRRTLGGLLATIGFCLLGSQVPAVGDWFTRSVFHAIAGATVIAAVATISCRSPVYCAIWFGMTLTGTAGLFLLAGAEFLAVSTIVVYAGAILVTFLFVLMLSEPEGHTTYDRHSWEAMLSAFAGMVLVGVLTTMIGATIAKAEAARVESAQTAAALPAPAADAPSPAPSAKPSPTIARIGAELFTRYLVPVEAAGALLFAALVGAAVIVNQGRAAMRRSPTSQQGGAANAS